MPLHSFLTDFSVVPRSLPELGTHCSGGPLVWALHLRLQVPGLPLGGRTGHRAHIMGPRSWLSKPGSPLSSLHGVKHQPGIPAASDIMAAFRQTSYELSAALRGNLAPSFFPPQHGRHQQQLEICHYQARDTGRQGLARRLALSWRRSLVWGVPPPGCTHLDWD